MGGVRRPLLRPDRAGPHGRTVLVRRLGPDPLTRRPCRCAPRRSSARSCSASVSSGTRRTAWPAATQVLISCSATPAVSTTPACHHRSPPARGHGLVDLRAADEPTGQHLPAFG